MLTKLLTVIGKNLVCHSKFIENNFINSNEQIAVFLDFENFIGFSHSLKLPIDLIEILEKLKEEGRIIIRKSFGDIVKSLAGIGQIKESDNVRRMLRDNLFNHEDIAYQNQFKTRRICVWHWK